MEGSLYGGLFLCTVGIEIQADEHNFQSTTVHFCAEKVFFGAEKVLCVSEMIAFSVEMGHCQWEYVRFR